jgi:hypothetical protein
MNVKSRGGKKYFLSGNLGLDPKMFCKTFLKMLGKITKL